MPDPLQSAASGGAPNASSLQSRRANRALVAALLGNTLEWYDYIVYAFLAIYIAKEFFPSTDETAALLATFATFALSFIIRPFAGILLGSYADRAGRRAALMLVMVTMTLATFIMCVVPSYAQIGAWATGIMIVARVLQAASAGGEFASAATYLLESIPEKRQGLFSGLYSAGPALAAALAGIVGVVLSESLSRGARDRWGWRVPFAVGLLIAPVTYYLRRHLPETPAFTALASRASRRGLAALLSRHKLSTAVAIALSAGGSAATYILLVFAPTYIARTLRLPGYMAYVTLIVGGLIGAAWTPFAGVLADKVGSRRVFGAATLLLIASIVPLYRWLNASPSLDRLLACTVIFSFLTWTIASVLPVLMAHLFPAECRSSGMAFSYNIGATVFGGASLYFVTALLAKTGSPLVPAFYLLGIECAVLLIVTSLYHRARCSASA